MSTRWRFGLRAFCNGLSPEPILKGDPQPLATSRRGNRGLHLLSVFGWPPREGYVLKEPGNVQVAHAPTSRTPPEGVFGRHPVVVSPLF